MSETPVPHVGDVFVESWGYDQTNKDFYQVVEVTKSGKSVWLIAVESVVVPHPSGDSHFTYEHVVPVKDAFKTPKFVNESNRYGGRFLKKVTHSDYGFWINLTSFSGASIWKGEPEYVTAQGFGH